MNPEEYQRNYQFENDYWWFVGRRRILDKLLNHFVGQRSAVLFLDVGCGTGSILEMLSDRGLCVGIDMSAEALEFCAQRSLRLLVQGDACALPIRGATMDVVLLLDVLEHVDDPVRCAAEARRVCKTNGYVIIYVPAYQWLWSGEDVVSRHKCRYTRHRLQRVVETAGLKCKWVSHVDALLLPAIAGAILFKRLFCPKARTESNLQALPRVLNGLLAWIFSLEALAIPALKFCVGASIICVAQPVDLNGEPASQPGDTPGSRVPEGSRPAS